MSDSLFYISSIEIEGLFGRLHLKWNTFQDVNILGGENGSGKSTILKSYYALLTEGHIADPKLASLMERIHIGFTNGYTLEWEKERVNQTDYRQAEGYKYYMDVRSMDADGNFTLQKTVVKDANASNVFFTDISQKLRILLINSFEQRIVRRDKEQNLGEDNRTYLDLLIHDQIFIRNSMYMGFFDRLLIKQTDEKPRAWSDEEHEELQKYVALYEKLQRFMTDYRVMNDNRLVFRRQGQDVIRYYDLSMGEKQLLLLLLMVANTRTEPCIFFMDEPDLGMHVAWKEILIKQMRELNPNMQIILSTHAPSMVEGWYEKVKEVKQLLQ